MMLQAIYQNQFKKDLKRAIKRDKNIHLLKTIIAKIVNEEALAPKNSLRAIIKTIGNAILSLIGFLYTKFLLLKQYSLEQGLTLIYLIENFFFLKLTLNISN